MATPAPSPNQTNAQYRGTKEGVFLERVEHLPRVTRRPPGEALLVPFASNDFEGILGTDPLLANPQFPLCAGVDPVVQHAPSIVPSFACALDFLIAGFRGLRRKRRFGAHPERKRLFLAAKAIN